MVHLANIPPFEKEEISSNLSLQEEVKSTNAIAHFCCNEQYYSICFPFRDYLDKYLDESVDNTNAFAKGYTEYCRLIVFEQKTGIPVCVREFYASDKIEPPRLSKKIVTDIHHQGRGIASSFIRAMEAKDFRIAWSEYKTPDGAALANRVDAER